MRTPKGLNSIYSSKRRNGSDTTIAGCYYSYELTRYPRVKVYLLIKKGGMPNNTGHIFVSYNELK